MSRCFPFPPPGYVRNGIYDDQLIESLKKEEEKAKNELKKEKKRERKEKKKKARERGELESKKHGHKRRHKDEGTKDQKVGDHQKVKENETELLEKSSLTEEHGHLIGSQNSCDSTLNSNKRQKQSPSPDGRHNNNSENIIRIRLPVKRQNGPQVLTSKEQQPCSSRGRIDDSSDNPCSTSTNIIPEHTIRLSEQNKTYLCGSSKQLSLKLTEEKNPSPPCSSSEQPTPRPTSKEKKSHPSSDSSKPCTQKPQTVQPSNICSICPPSVALQFQMLIESWIPSPVERELTDFNDQEWLLRGNNLSYGPKRCEVSSAGMNVENPTTPPWPSACFLPEADVYALPFTIPF